MSMYKISSFTSPSGGSGALFFDNIPQNFKHLRLISSMRTKQNQQISSTFFSIYNVYGSIGPTNYASRGVTGDGSTTYTFNQSFSTPAYVNPGLVPALTALPNSYGTLIMEFMDYSSNSKNKTVNIYSGYDLNGAGSVGAYSALFVMPEPIKGFFIDFISGIEQDSKFDLYGIYGDQI